MGASHLAVPLPWERLLWSGRARLRLPASRYFLTDFRIVRVDGEHVAELALHDIKDVRLVEGNVDRILGTSTIVVHSGRSAQPLTLRAVHRGAQLAALLEVLSGELPKPMDADAVLEALKWEPRTSPRVGRKVAAAVAVVVTAVLGIAIGLHGKAGVPAYAADDPIYPGGTKRDRADIVEFMERDVMPWARAALGPIKGGPDFVTCETCHGPQPESHGWSMPAVVALPQPAVVTRGWERYGGPMDAQMRNAIYGYVADAGKQTRASYMREVVMPGMARLLRRPAYDFTKPYDENRVHQAFGCYHCHRVK